MGFGTLFGFSINPLLAAIESGQATGHNDKTRHLCWKSVLWSFEVLAYLMARKNGV